VSTALLGSLLPLTVAVPIVAAACCPIVARRSRRAPMLLSVVALLASGALLCCMAPSVYDGHVLVHFMGHWVPVQGHALGISFAADAWGLTYALMTAFLGALLVLSTLSELGELGPKELGGYSCLFLLLCAALIGAALTGDLFNLFVWFEVAALASYALTAFFLERAIALEAAFKVLVLTTIASFAIFLGAALVYSSTGALDLGEIERALSGRSGAPVALVALGLLVGGFATKAGILPFHGWLPDAHEAAPGPVSALFSGLMVNLGVVAIARLVFEVFTTGHGHDVLGLLMVLGVTSAVGGALLALVQDDLKRLLAYDTISQMGVLLVGLASASATGLAGASYHLVDHALFKALLFLCAGSIVHMTGATKLSEMGGLAKRYPLVAAAFVVGVLSISGVPPFNGYVSLGLIHEALRSRHELTPFVAMLVSQVVTMAALGRAAWLAFFAPPARGEVPPHGQDLRAGMAAAMIALSAGCLAFGVLPTVVLAHVAAPAAAALLHPAGYAGAVLASGGSIPPVRVSFDYWDPAAIATVVGTVVLAVPCAVLAGRVGERARAVTRRLQTGSVNDYAGYLVGGMVLTVAVLAR